MISGYPIWVVLIIGVGVFAAGFVDSIGGGGGIISVPIYLLSGLPTHFALGMGLQRSDRDRLRRRSGLCFGAVAWRTLRIASSPASSRTSPFSAAATPKPSKPWPSSSASRWSGIDDSVMNYMLQGTMQPERAIVPCNLLWAGTICFCENTLSARNKNAVLVRLMDERGDEA